LIQQAVVGKVVSAWGTKGELKVFPLINDLSFFLELKHLFLRSSKGNLLEIRVGGIRKHNKFVLVQLEGVASKEEAEAYRGYEVLVPSPELPALDEGEYYYFQLEGLRVLTSDGLDLGILDHVMETGGNDVYVVESSDGREILIPAIRDVISKVDLERREMIITPIEGMLE